MKRLTMYILSMFIAVSLLTGCGSGTTTNGSTETSMVIGTAYTVATGDKVVPDGTSTITVEHLLDATTKTVTLLSGSATLIQYN